MRMPSDVDLNLLAVMHVLLEERSVSRAALRLGRTQSAVSHALGRLRELLGDPLLVRGPGGMEPSSRALELQRPLADALDALGRVVMPRGSFDASKEQAIYRVGALDYFSYLLLPQVVRLSSQEAPGVDVEVSATADDAPDLLISGQLELALGMFGELPPALHRQKLFTERVVCVVRADHPLVGDTLDLDAYTSLPHILITTGKSTRSLVDAALERMNRQRRIALKVPHFPREPGSTASSATTIVSVETSASIHAVSRSGVSANRARRTVIAWSAATNRLGCALPIIRAA